MTLTCQESTRSKLSGLSPVCTNIPPYPGVPPSFPQTLKPTARHPCVDDRVAGISMAQVILHDPQIRGLVGQVIAAGVPEHMRIDVRQAGVVGDAGDQVVDCLARHLGATLVHEQPGKAIRARAQVALDCPELVAIDRLLNAERALAALNPYPRRLQVDGILPHAGRLADAQAVPIHHQDEQVVADAVAAALGGLQHAIHLGLTQVVLVALVGIGSYRSTILIYTLYNT